jgi:hypothetical protein
VIKPGYWNETCFTLDCREPTIGTSWFCERHTDSLSYNARVERKMSSVESIKPCERCGGKMVLRRGPKGLFYACIGFKRKGKQKCYFVRTVKL